MGDDSATHCDYEVVVMRKQNKRPRPCSQVCPAENLATKTSFKCLLRLCLRRTKKSKRESGSDVMILKMFLP
jgi:hypothetical protein